MSMMLKKGRLDSRMLEGVSVIAELEHFGIEFVYSGSETIKCICCFHDDKSPSVIFRLSTASFECKSCGAKGDLVDFLAKYSARPRVDVLALLSKRYNLTTHLRPISVTLVEEAHAAIWTAEALRKELYKRCVTDDLIRRYRIGMRDNRISIPVMDPGGRAFINIRSYLPGAPGAQKMKNLKGRSKLCLYPHDQMQYDTVVLAGGEMKAVAAIPILNRHAIGAVAVTGGEGEWDNELNGQFSGKHVVIVFDIDEKGQKAAKKLARILTPVARSVRIARLPLSIGEFPTGDINDFLAIGGNLLEVVEKAETYDPRITRVDWSTGEYTTRRIDEAISADRLGVRSSVSALITGVADQRFSVPKSVQVCCTRDSKLCGQCPVAILDKDVYNVPSESPNIIAMLETSDEMLARVLDRELSVPSKCTVHHYAVVERQGAEVAVIAPPIELKASAAATRESQKIVVLGDGISANEEYILDGRAQPDPKSQETVFLVSKFKKKVSSLSGYVFDHDDICSVFQPPSWTTDGLDLHLSDIYDALASVTGIRERADLHLMIDLVYHSVLNIKPEINIERGWVEALILGDSSQGKTQATIGLQRHYGLGHKVDAKNASVAGLIGGLQKLAGMWMITWGAMPTHDQRLVILEELKGAKVEVISALTDVRSSGVATLEKIRAGRRMSRTRLLALSNPRSSRPLNTYSHGVEAILELVGAPEDVRRFDACLCVGKEDIGYDIIHQLHEVRRDHPYTSDACHHNIMWAWTRTPEQVKFPRTTWAAILDTSKRLCKLYSEQIPIVDAGSMRLKLARLCASLAARTFSTDDSENLLVRECHVEYIDRALCRMYNSQSMRYDTYSERQTRLLSVMDPKDVLNELMGVPFPKKLVDYLHGTSWLTSEELQHHGGLDRSGAEQLIGGLARNYAISQRGRNYVASPGFRTLLDKLVKELPNDRF
jgi:hypothetical protein